MKRRYKKRTTRWAINKIKNSMDSWARLLDKEPPRLTKKIKKKINDRIQFVLVSKLPYQRSDKEDTSFAGSTQLTS